MKFAIATASIGVVVIKVTQGNRIVFTNISFGKGEVLSVININVKFIALCTDSGIEVYNKKLRQLIYKIPKN